ncbi:MAG: carbohydrate porin [Polyangiaceae bacterium]
MKLGARSWGALLAVELVAGTAFGQPGAAPPDTTPPPATGPTEVEEPKPETESSKAEAPAEPAPRPERDVPRGKVPAVLGPVRVEKAKLDYPRSSFSFGSYGRVVVASDGRGGEGRSADVVAYGSRIDETSYAELELRRDDEWEADLSSRVVTTLALGGPLFHYDGKFDAKVAVRNLYLEERGIGDKGLSAWAGSRMYRGDDIYLLDFWPLDNLNTVGGGVRFDTRDDHSFVAWHIGLNRADDPFQYQVEKRAAPLNQPGTADVAILDRPRVISSLKLSHIEPLFGPNGGVKAVLWGEVHRLPSGERQKQPGVLEEVPGDSGVLVGGQVGLFTGEHDTFVNLFVRHGRGLAAYGELATPEGTSPERTVEGATQTLIGLSGNYENHPFGVVVGGYFRTFREPTPEKFNINNVDEGIFVARPHVFLGDHAGVAVEGSYQAQQRGVLNIATNRPLHARLWRFGLIPYLSPSGAGVFKRPVLRAILAFTQRNDDARALYAYDDNFARRKVEQFYGIGAEWWFNSSSYGK